MANWLAPGHLMVGRYPLLEEQKEKCQKHLRRLVTEAKITTFVCLQSEVPAQSDVRNWPPGGIKVKRRRCLPYARIAQQFAGSAAKLHFLHEPLDDLEIPGNKRLREFTAQLEERVQQGEKLLLHCMGGRGRSNLVAGCLLAQMYHLSAEKAATYLQFAYDSRDYDNCVVPETERQRAMLRDFCASYSVAA